MFFQRLTIAKIVPCNRKGTISFRAHRIRPLSTTACLHAEIWQGCKTIQTFT